jgi:hypothetical protein
MPNKKTTPAAGETDWPQSPTLIAPNIDLVSDSDIKEPQGQIRSMINDEYPHGMQLIFLAGASVIAVFLIALDQVSASCTHFDT